MRRSSESGGVTLTASSAVVAAARHLMYPQTGPPTHACLASPRIVNYETGKAGAKARSLWRLEPLRIRWVEFLLSIIFFFLLLLSFILSHFQCFLAGGSQARTTPQRYVNWTVS